MTIDTITVSGPTVAPSPRPWARVTIDLAEYLELERAIYVEVRDPGMAALYAMSAYPSAQHAELMAQLGPFFEHDHPSLELEAEPETQPEDER